jgi:ribosomal protein L2
MCLGALERYTYVFCVFMPVNVQKKVLMEKVKLGGDRNEMEHVIYRNNSLFTWKTRSTEFFKFNKLCWDNSVTQIIWTNHKSCKIIELVFELTCYSKHVSKSKDSYPKSSDCYFFYITLKIVLHRKSQTDTQHFL